MEILPKIAKGVGIIGLVTVGLSQTYRMLFFSKLRQTKQYNEAMEILRSHKKAMTYLGEPVKEGMCAVGPYVGSKSWFSVNLKGSNTRAKLVCDYVVNSDDQKTSTLTKMQITFDNIPDKIFVIMQKPDGQIDSK